MFREWIVELEHVDKFLYRNIRYIRVSYWVNFNLLDRFQSPCIQDSATLFLKWYFKMLDKVSVASFCQDANPTSVMNSTHKVKTGDQVYAFQNGYHPFACCCELCLHAGLLHYCLHNATSICCLKTAPLDMTFYAWGQCELKEWANSCVHGAE